MKKLLAMVLAIAMILSMAACGGSGKGNKTENRQGGQGQQNRRIVAGLRGSDIVNRFKISSS